MVDNGAKIRRPSDHNLVRVHCLRCFSLSLVQHWWIRVGYAELFCHLRERLYTTNICGALFFPICGLPELHLYGLLRDIEPNSTSAERGQHGAMVRCRQDSEGR